MTIAPNWEKTSEPSRPFNLAPEAGSIAIRRGTSEAEPSVQRPLRTSARVTLHANPERDTLMRGLQTERAREERRHRGDRVASVDDEELRPRPVEPDRRQRLDRAVADQDRKFGGDTDVPTKLGRCQRQGGSS